MVRQDGCLIAFRSGCLLCQGSPLFCTILFNPVEPIGPKNLLDLMLIAPCTGNTLGKLANGINDTTVTMAAKSSLRNGNPLILAVSTNDALGGSAQNIGRLMNVKRVYFVPMAQDDPKNKPASAVAFFDLIAPTLLSAMSGEQIQPVWR